MANVGFEVPATFAFLTVGAEDFDGREAADVFFGGGAGASVGSGDLGDVKEFLQREKVIDDPGGNAVI